MCKTSPLRMLLFFILVFGFGCQKTPSVPDPEPNPEDNLLQENVSLIDSSEFNLVSSSQEIENGVFRFNFSGNAPEIMVGDVIVGDQGAGFLRKVEDISVVDGEIIFQTSQGTLEDLFVNANVDFNTSLDSSIQIRNGGLRYEIEDLSLLNEGPISLRAKGFIEFDSDFNFDLALSNSNVDSISFETQNARVSSSLTLTAVAEGNVQLLNETDTLACFQKTFTKWVPAFGVPVPVKVEVITYFTIKYSMDVSARAETSVTVNNDNQVYLGVNYSNGGWNGTYDLQPNYEIVPPSLSGQVGSIIRADLIPSIDVKLYGVVGPYASVELKEVLEGNIASPPLTGISKLLPGLRPGLEQMLKFLERL